MSILNSNQVKYEIERILKEKYNIIAKNIEKSEQSTDGNVYIINCNDTKYVIKIYKEISHTKSMIDLYRTLEIFKVNTPKIIYSKDKKGFEQILDTNYIVVYTYINGQQLEYDRLDKEIIIAIARELRKLHNITEKSKFNLHKVPFVDENGRQSVLHYDLTKNNIFISNYQIYFIDFDDAKYGSAVCDIAILISNLFFSKKHGADLEGVKIFIDEYYCNEPEIKKKETPLIKEYALQWIDYILKGNNFDTSTTESFEIRKKLITENL